MGLGLDPIPSSPSSARREASEKIIPQVYKGHANYERVKRVTFFGPKSEYMVKADKRMVNFIGSHPHTAALVSCGSEDIKIWTPKAIDKAVTPTQIELDQQSKRAMANVDMAVVDVWQREVGELSNRKFAHGLAASQKLEKNYVKTVSFNADGNILVSGSQGKRIMLWDWEIGIRKLTFESGRGDLWHGFQAKIMPYTDDRSLITCGGDGQVRHAQISKCGVETMLLAKHQCNASDLAFEPGSPHLIYTCGEDGLVQHIYLRTAAATELLRCQPIRGCRVRNPVIPLYAIAIDPRNPNIFAVVGSDQYARLYDIHKYKCGGSTDFSDL
ncbi:hypothetical protein V6N13_055833 [Hibiscus sabdariffa]